MSESRFSMPLFKARAAGDRILDTLWPVIEFGVVCGSVRRERPEAHDLDIVIVPRRAPEVADGFVHRWDASFLELVRNCPRWSETPRDPLAQDRPGAQRSIFEGADTRITASSRQITLYSVLEPRLRIELWCATPDNAGWITMLRTGDRHFTHDLVAAARLNRTPETGLSFDDGWLWRGGDRVPTPDEASVFDALGLIHVPPRDRDASTLAPLFRPHSLVS